MEDLIPIGRVERMLNVSRLTLYRWEKQGIGIPVRIPRGLQYTRFYRKETIEKMKRYNALSLSDKVNFKGFLDFEEVKK